MTERVRLGTSRTACCRALSRPAGQGALLYSGTWHGRDSVVQDVWTSFVRHWGGPGVVGLETHQFLDAGDHVVVTGRFFGTDAEGRSLDTPCGHVWSMSDGLGVRFQNSTDWSVQRAVTVSARRRAAVHGRSGLARPPASRSPAERPSGRETRGQSASALESWS